MANQSGVLYFARNFLRIILCRSIRSAGFYSGSDESMTDEKHFYSFTLEKSLFRLRPEITLSERIEDLIALADLVFVGE